MSIVDELIAVLGYQLTGERDAEKFEKKIDSISNKLGDLADKAGQFAGATSLALATGFGIFGKSVVDTTAQFEVYQATLETIEGSSEKARQSLDWISEFGKTTPFDVAQVTEAFVKLKAFGIDPIADDALRVLGDTSAAMGKPLEQAVEALADAATGEFERLKEFGIKAKSEGDNVTFAWTKNGEQMTQTVKKSSNEIRAFLLQTMGDRFSGAMERQSKTWNGMMSNLGDTWTDFQRRVGEAGFFDAVKGNLESLLSWLGRLDADGTLDKWAKNLSDALTTASGVVSAIAVRIGANVQFIIENFEKFQPLFIAIGTAFGALIWRAFPLITLFTLIALAVDDLFAYLQNGESYIGDFIAKIQDLTGVSEGVAQAIAGLGGAVLVALTSAFVFAPGLVIRIFGKALLLSLTALAPVILQGAVAAFALLSNPVGWAVLIGGAAIGLMYYFKDELAEAWEWLKGQVVPMFADLKNWLLEIDWANVGLTMMTAFFYGMIPVGAKIKEWLASLIPDWARDWFASGSPNTRPTTTDQRIAGEDQVMNSAFPQNGNDRFNGAPARAIDPEQISRIERMLERNATLSARMNESNAVEATVNDSRADNRQFPMTNTVTVNQNVTNATSAPRQAANATGDAVSNALPRQRSQIETEPSF